MNFEPDDEDYWEVILLEGPLGALFDEPEPLEDDEKQGVIAMIRSA